MSMTALAVVGTVVALALLATYMAYREERSFEAAMREADDEFWDDYLEHVHSLPMEQREFVLDVHGVDDPDEIRDAERR